MNIHPHGPGLELAVELSPLAVLRGAGREPDLLQAALQAQEAGADGIVLDLGKTGGLIGEAELRNLMERVHLPLTLVLPADGALPAVAGRLRPSRVCLVPQRGPDGINHARPHLARWREQGATVSLLIEADLWQVQMAAEAGAAGIVIDTRGYAQADLQAQGQALHSVQQATLEAVRCGLRVAAGGGLHYDNVQAVAALDGVAEIQLGQALAARALFEGWQKAVRDMKAAIVLASLQADSAARSGA